MKYASVQSAQYSLRGFTLVEIMVATAVTVLLLVGLSFALGSHFQGSQDLESSIFSERYRRAMQVINRDLRGLVQIETLQTARSDRGVLVAYFETTARLEAVIEGNWVGVCHVGYWVQDDPVGGVRLWRSEGILGQPDEKISWTPLLDELDQFDLMCQIDSKWVRWPEDKEQLTNVKISNIRIVMTRWPMSGEHPQSLGTSVFQPICLRTR